MKTSKSLTIFLFYILIFPAYAASSPPPIQLANIYSKNIDLKDYWVSEKLDGVRAYWNGKELISKKGNIINAPKWFTKNFPQETIEGELWIGRNQFELTSGIIRQQNPDNAGWQQIHFMIFDMPKHQGTFTQRLAVMTKLIENINSKYLQLIKQSKITNQRALMKQLNITVKNGGEGLMLHRGGAFYKVARNDDLLKVKTFEDAEAVVIAHIKGNGKYQGILGAILVENEDKVQFKIGTGFTDQQRKDPPKIGSIITYKYFGKTKNNIPRFASFMRIREEI